MSWILITFRSRLNYFPNLLISFSRNNSCSYTLRNYFEGQREKVKLSMLWMSNALKKLYLFSSLVHYNRAKIVAVNFSNLIDYKLFLPFYFPTKNNASLYEESLIL